MRGEATQHLCKVYYTIANPHLCSVLYPWKLVNEKIVLCCWCSRRRKPQLCKVHQECKPTNSPLRLCCCCCGSWAEISTRRLCPMIQPLRGPYLSCTFKPYTTQIHSFTCRASSATKSPYALRSFMLLCVCHLAAFCAFSSILPSSLPRTISSDLPSLPPGVGLPLPCWPSLLGS